MKNSHHQKIILGLDKKFGLNQYQIVNISENNNDFVVNLLTPCGYKIVVIDLDISFLPGKRR